MRRYANALQWLSFVLFASAAIPLAYLRELRSGNQQAAVAKARGFIEGLRVPLTDPPRFEPEASLSESLSSP